MLLFSKWIVQTPHYPQGVNQQISQEKTNCFVMETIIVIYQHKKKINVFWLSESSV